MKRNILINILTFYCISVYSQAGNSNLFKEYEDTLKVIANSIIYSQHEIDRYKANEVFIKNLKEVLVYEKSFNFPFESLSTVSKLTSPDRTFRIFNWVLRRDNNSYDYFAIVHYYNKKHKRYEIIPLIDNSTNIRNAEQKNLDAKNWYGALYYQISYIKKAGRKYYTLLGWDGNDNYSTKKIIDVMYFSGKNKIKFGLPIFKNKTESKKRVILEFNSKTSISVKYHKNKKRIVFNHLVPIREDLKGLEEYYIPEGTFNSYDYTNGKWILNENIEIGNQQKINNKKRPLNGILPR
jgi:hypothetical protein